MLSNNATKWDRTVDLVIVGYGLAGAVTALTASDMGASVIVLEKQDDESHCSTSSISGGVFICPTAIKGTIKYLEAVTQASNGMRWTSSAIIRAWAEKAVENADWIRKLGGNAKLEGRPAAYMHLPGAETIVTWRYSGCGVRMMGFMKQVVKSRRVEVLYRTPVARLLTNGVGEVIGVTAKDISSSRPKTVNIRASKAVVLCSGGFEENEEMKLQYLRIYPLYFAGAVGNTGDGILMAQEVGADLWHMNCCSARLCAKFPDFQYAFLMRFGARSRCKEAKALPGYIFVDKHGKRYMNENFKEHTAWYEMTRFDTYKLEYPAVPSWYIFDQRRMAGGTLSQLTSGPAGPQQLYKWSHDNNAELKRGWIISGSTISELARKIKVPCTNLEKSISRWNSICEKRRDPDFGRVHMDLMPIDESPFYAIKLFPGGLNTQGGPRRNEKAQVVNPFGEPIPGLYAAGSCGSIYGMLYPGGGGNLAECIAFGRIAAENAVKEKERV